MDRKNVIRKTAILLADAAFKKWGETGIPRYLAGFSIDRSAPSDEIRSGLADYLEKNMLERYPEDTYTQRLEDEIKAAKTDDLLELISLNRSIDPRTVEYAAFKPLYNPDEGPDWYGMSRAELRLQMKKLGYDPDKGGQAEMVRFMDALRDNATRYERLKGVEEGLEGAGPVIASLVSPSYVEESVKQSVTGQYDDDKATRARVVDFLVNSLMAGGLTGAIAPGRLLQVPARAIPVASTPVRAGVIAGATEEMRQLANLAEGRDASYVSAPLGAGIAAGTVPAAAQYFASILSKGTDPTARVFARGVARGLRNYDPVKAERQALGEEILRARKLNQSMPEPATIMEGGRNFSGGYAITNAQMAGTEAIQGTIEKLRSLGFPLRSELDAMMKYSKEYKGPKPVTRPITVEDILGASAATGQKKSAGMVGGISMKPAGKTVLSDNKESIIFKPVKGEAWDPLDEVMEAYDSPKLYLSFQEPGEGTSLNAYRRNLLDYQRAKALFPAKTESEIAKGSNPTKYARGLFVGGALGNIFGRVEPITRVNLLSPGEAAARPKEFKQRSWYQDAVGGGKKKKGDGEDEKKLTVGKYRTHKLIGGN